MFFLDVEDWNKKRLLLMLDKMGKYVRRINLRSLINITRTDDYSLAQLIFATGDSMSDI